MLVGSPNDAYRSFAGNIHGERGVVWVVEALVAALFWVFMGCSGAVEGVGLAACARVHSVGCITSWPEGKGGRERRRQCQSW